MFHFLILALIGLTSGLEFGPSLNVCSNPPKTTETLPDQLKLPLNYKISGSVTDWFRQQTSLIEETSTRDFRVLERKGNGNIEKWIQDYRENNEIIFINSSAPNDCNRVSNQSELINSELFRKITGSQDTTSINSLVNGVVEFVKKTPGFVVEDSVVGGMNARTWITCIDGNDWKALLEVKYGGYNTVDPAISNFHNPLILSFRIAELSSFNSTISRNHWSVELGRYENPNGDEAKIPSGMYCENRNESSLELKSLNEYSAVLNYFNHENNESRVIEVFYSVSRQQFILSGESFENILNKEYPQETDFILHDFKYGYEFTMGNGACNDFSELPSRTNDVLLEKRYDGLYFLQKPLEFTIVPYYIGWSQYRESEEFIDLRGVDWKGMGKLWELRLTLDREIHSFKIYDINTNKLILSMTVNKVNKSSLNRSLVLLESCYDDGTPGNNTWILPIKNKNLVDLKRTGLPLLNEAVSNAINKAIHPVISYRISVQYMINQINQLSLILRISERSVIEPSLVDSYNYTEEADTGILFEAVNLAVRMGKMPIEVETIDGPETWIIDASSMKPFSIHAEATIHLTTEAPKTDEHVQLKIVLSFIFAILIVILGLVATWIIVVMLLNRGTTEKKQMTNNLLLTLENQKF